MTTVDAAVVDESDLKTLVLRHRVCFESYPIWHVPAGGGMVKIGYELDLIGTHDHPQHPPSPGCDECKPVRRALFTIATAILPPNDRASRYAMEPFETAISFSPRRKMRNDVTLAIDIMHRGQFDLPVDECEMHCLREMKERLKALGARAEHW